MAIWQFDFYAVPEQNSFIVDINEKMLWNEKELFIAEELKSSMPLQKSWSEQIIQYGKEDETCIQILSINSRLEVLVRIDLRFPNIDVINLIINFLKNNDAVILCNDTTFEPTNKNVYQLIKDSDAFKFCINPHGFIESISATKIL